MMMMALAMQRLLLPSGDSEGLWWLRSPIPRFPVLLQ
jgi:hypothetical protein